VQAALQRIRTSPIAVLIVIGIGCLAAGPILLGASCSGAPDLVGFMLYVVGSVIFGVCAGLALTRARRARGRSVGWGSRLTASLLGVIVGVLTLAGWSAATLQAFDHCVA
jgi:hypothetical protein